MFDLIYKYNPKTLYFTTVFIHTLLSSEIGIFVDR